MEAISRERDELRWHYYDRLITLGLAMLFAWGVGWFSCFAYYNPAHLWQKIGTEAPTKAEQLDSH